MVQLQSRKSEGTEACVRQVGDVGEKMTLKGEEFTQQTGQRRYSQEEGSMELSLFLNFSSTYESSQQHNTLLCAGSALGNQSSV